jgi:hypothetical protein
VQLYLLAPHIIVFSLSQEHHDLTEFEETEG